MLVYGDDWRVASPEDMILHLERDLEASCALAGPERRDLLTAALILAGELTQGVADAEFAAQGFDDATPAQNAAMKLTIAVAGLLLSSAGEPAADAPDAAAALAELRSCRLPSSLRCKTPEGYAFYAVYPERYAAAAAAHAWRGRPLAIGLRSIGTSLAAAVAARVGGRAVTVRPTGHPFRRELRLSQALTARLAGHDGPFAVIDEGPGLSGSSFGAVADLLEDLGVAPERIVFMPSHAGDLGPHAAPPHRARWARAKRLTVDFAVPEGAAGAWFADVIGPAAIIEDLSGGAWRGGLPEGEWPPAAPAMERRKYRLTGAAGVHVARFAGLGAIGERKLGTARLLHAAGFAPEPLALRRGFLLERWVEGERLDASAGGQREVLAQIARYLGFRARALPAGVGGASLAALREMAACNAAELGGAELGGRVEARLAGIEGLPGLAPVRIDGRPHPWEWLRRPDGSLCKTDALDHAAAHDLVGRQDIAWDVAGASVEFGLSERATEELRAGVSGEAGRAVSPEAVSAFRLCYAAFQAGAWTMAGAAAPAERARIQPLLDRYAAVLREASRAVGPRGGVRA